MLNQSTSFQRQTTSITSAPVHVLALSSSCSLLTFFFAFIIFRPSIRLLFCLPLCLIRSCCKILHYLSNQTHPIWLWLHLILLQRHFLWWGGGVLGGLDFTVYCALSHSLWLFIIIMCIIMFIVIIQNNVIVLRLMEGVYIYECQYLLGRCPETMHKPP